MTRYDGSIRRLPPVSIQERVAARSVLSSVVGGFVRPLPRGFTCLFCVLARRLGTLGCELFKGGRGECVE